MSRRVIVAMSGGVDSSVAALLLKKSGFEVFGVTFVFHSKDHIRDAENAASRIGIPLFVVDASEDFKRIVVDNFVEEYRNARTPIPCARCNMYLKFGILYKKAEEMSADYVATGHYARILERDGLKYVGRAVDLKKDQSYFLFGLRSQDLSRTIFPLGELRKEDVKRIAGEFGLHPDIRRESQDACFIEGRELRQVLVDLGLGEMPGKIKDENGKIMGVHRGYYFYTLGQRRGLGVRAGRPLYITHIDRDKNELVLGNKNKLFITEFVVEHPIFANEAEERIAEEGMRCVVRVRYSHAGTAGFVRFCKGFVRVRLDEPYGPVVPGQACVFYKGDLVVGGGFISDRTLWESLVAS